MSIKTKAVLLFTFMMAVSSCRTGKTPAGPVPVGQTMETPLPEYDDLDLSGLSHEVLQERYDSLSNIYRMTLDECRQALEQAKKLGGEKRIELAKQLYKRTAELTSKCLQYNRALRSYYINRIGSSPDTSNQKRNFDLIPH